MRCSRLPLELSSRHARPWLDRVHRPRLLPCLWNLARWAVRRPVRLASSVALVCADYWRRPLTLLRSLATVPVAAVHATTLDELGTDHVHAHFATYPALAAWLCWAAVRRALFVHRPRPRPLHARAGPEAPRKGRGVRREHLRVQQATAAELVPADVPIHVIHCGVELGHYSFRARGPEPEGPVKALCVASLREKKGHTVLFDALASAGPASTASRSTWSATAA